MASVTLSPTQIAFAAAYGPGAGGGDEYEVDGRTLVSLLDEGGSFEQRTGIALLYEMPIDFADTSSIDSATLNIGGDDVTGDIGGTVAVIRLTALATSQVLPTTASDILDASQVSTFENANGSSFGGSDFGVDVRNLLIDWKSSSTRANSGYLVLLFLPEDGECDGGVDFGTYDLDLVYTPFGDGVVGTEAELVLDVDDILLEAVGYSPQQYGNITIDVEEITLDAIGSPTAFASLSLDVESLALDAIGHAPEQYGTLELDIESIALSIVGTPTVNATLNLNVDSITLAAFGDLQAEATLSIDVADVLFSVRQDFIGSLTLDVDDIAAELIGSTAARGYLNLDVESVFMSVMGARPVANRSLFPQGLLLDSHYPKGF